MFTVYDVMNAMGSFQLVELHSKSGDLTYRGTVGSLINTRQDLLVHEYGNMKRVDGANVVFVFTQL